MLTLTQVTLGLLRTPCRCVLALLGRAQPRPPGSSTEYCHRAVIILGLLGWVGLEMIMRLGLISSIALAGFLYMSAPPGAVAAQVPQAVVQTVESSSHNTTVLAYYYYHGRRYPYRY